MARSLRSTGIVPLHRYYGAVRPYPAHRYFRPRGLCRLRLFPLHRRVGSHAPHKSLVELRAAYMAGCRLVSLRTSSKLIPEEGSPPGFGII